MQSQVAKRNADGIHWRPEANRFTSVIQWIRCIYSIKLNSLFQVDDQQDTHPPRPGAGPQTAWAAGVTSSGEAGDSGAGAEQGADTGVREKHRLQI